MFTPGLICVSGMIMCRKRLSYFASQFFNAATGHLDTRVVRLDIHLHQFLPSIDVHRLPQQELEYLRCHLRMPRCLPVNVPTPYAIERRLAHERDDSELGPAGVDLFR